MKFFFKYSFSILLVLTCLVVLPFGLHHALGVQSADSGGIPVSEDGADDPGPTTGSVNDAGNTGAAAIAVSPGVHSGSGMDQNQPQKPTEPQRPVQTQAPAETPAPFETPDPAQTPGSIQIPAPSEAPDSEPIPSDTTDSDAPAYPFADVGAEYFDDALFIGDSRTVGIYEYGCLGNAVFFANTGMSVYNVFSKTISVAGIGSTDLSALLENYAFGKIYIMLGINELGYNYAQTVEKYAEVVAKLKALEPDALIYIESNLHVTETKSAGDPIFNNENIGRFNCAISQLCDGATTFYLDVNPLFDDGCGNLAAEFTGDGVHVYAKYFKIWSEWFSTVAIAKCVDPAEPSA